jgi:hypothetical protein
MKHPWRPLNLYVYGRYLHLLRLCNILWQSDIPVVRCAPEEMRSFNGKRVPDLEHWYELKHGHVFVFTFHRGCVSGRLAAPTDVIRRVEEVQQAALRAGLVAHHSMDTTCPICVGDIL